MYVYDNNNNKAKKNINMHVTSTNKTNIRNSCCKVNAIQHRWNIKLQSKMHFATQACQIVGEK